MGQLRNLLRGLGGNCTRGALSRKGRGRSASHIDSCPECAALQWRERQYLERLQRAAIPAASDDLTARLLARTRQLAMAAPAGPTRNSAAASPALKALGLAAGGALAAAGVVMAAAYILAGDPMPMEDGTAAASFQQQASTFGQQASAGVFPLGGSEPAGSGSPATGSKDAATLGTAGLLGPVELQGLRAQGWSCPELRDMGFHVLWARREAVLGQGVLELRLTDGKHFATVLEQRPRPGQAGGSPSTVTASAPTNILTGRLASEDGFVHAPQSGAPAGSALWINASAPWKAIYQTSGVTFTYISDLPADTADDGVAELVRSGSAAAVERASGNPAGAGTASIGARDAEALPARLQRGLGRIMEFFTP